MLEKVKFLEKKILLLKDINTVIIESLMKRVVSIGSLLLQKFIGNDLYNTLKTLYLPKKRDVGNNS